MPGNRCDEQEIGKNCRPWYDVAMNQIVHVILTLPEAARFLRISKETLHKLAKEGKVPARKVGAEWRFLRSALEDWVRGQGDPQAALLQQAGLFKDDPDLPRILNDIYRARGRPENEDG